MEFGLFTFGDYFFKGNEGQVAFKNDQENIELVGTSQYHIEFVASELEDASPDMKRQIVDSKLGVESLMFSVQTVDGDYSSDNAFTEEDFDEKKKDLKVKKNIKDNCGTETK